MDSNATATNRDELLIRSDADGIATLTLNRPKQFNALSMDMLADGHITIEQRHVVINRDLPERR
ncbi:MAG: hypothetical protein K8R10_00020 [Rhodocyclales bacterium]|nr:hypothetical protein [Rhodocyclales bacterium]